MLFDPATLPPRDEDGYTWHPDLDERFQHDKWDEYVDSDKFRAHGLEIACTDFESDDVPDEIHRRYFESGEAVPDWQPTLPEGTGWRVVAIYETEDGPAALFARDIAQGSVQ